MRLTVWGLVGLAILLRGGALILEAARGESIWLNLMWAFLAWTAIIVGATIVSVYPTNPIGWLMLAVVAEPLSIFAEAYALHEGGGLPWAGAAAWVLHTFGPPIPTLPLLLVFLLFPGGHPPSRGWRPVVWVTWAWIFLLVSVIAFAPVNVAAEPGSLQNPLSVPDSIGEILITAQGAAWSLAPVLGFLSVLALLSRFLRSHGLERQQLKWVLFGASLVITVGAAAVMTSLTGLLGGAISQDLLGMALLLALLTLLASIGIAILRYRLYDIDLVINRTLVYGALTGFLGLVYVGGVVGLSQLVPGQDNDLAVAAATLAVAALFSPARRRIQAFVDRRFYRSRYDARQTLEAFGSRLREEVELETLLSDLQVVVEETLHPSWVGVWVRE